MEMLLGLTALIFLGFLLTGIIRFVLNLVKRNNEKSSKKFFLGSLIAFVAMIVFSILTPTDDTTEPTKKEKEVVAADSNDKNDSKKDEKIEEPEPEPVIPLTYDETDLEADEDGEFDINLTLGEGFEVNSVKGAELKDWGDGDVDLTGTISPDKKSTKVVLKISNGQDTRKEVITIDNDADIIAAIDAKRAAEKAAKKEKEAAEKEKARLAKLKEEAIANAQKITYNHLIKTKDGYKGEQYYIGKAQVSQAFEEDGVTLMLVNITDKGYGFWSDPVAVIYQGTTDAIADDFIQVYGTLGEQYEYQTKIGGTNSVPSLLASEIKVIQ